MRRRGVRAELRIGRKNGLDENESDDSCDGRLRMEEADETLKDVAIPAMAMAVLRKVCDFLSIRVCFPGNLEGHDNAPEFFA